MVWFSKHFTKVICMVWIQSFVFGDFQNVVEKISAFFKNGPRQAVCILAATGAVSNVTLYQPGVSDDFLRYEVKL